MGKITELLGRYRADRVSLQLEDIQGLILRSRPEPYVGLHAMLRFDEAEGARDLVARLTPHVSNAQDWTEEAEAWLGAALSYQGLKALGVPESSLSTFPLSFQQGMAARARQLIDVGENAPEQWEEIYQDDGFHLAITIYARDSAALEHARATAMTELDSSTGVTLLGEHQFGVDEEAKNPFGYRDSISQPTVAGSGVKPLPGQERAIAAGEFILGEESENGESLGVPSPEVLGRNGSFVVMRKYHSRPGAFNDFLRSQEESEDEQDRLGAKMFGRWRSGAPLELAPEADDPELGADPARRDAFRYKEDPRGAVCPFSAHSRRMNPRDSPLTIMTDVNIHRIIRRSSTFGAAWDRERTAAQDESMDTGLYFIFISARAFDTVEFLQQEWINGGNFINLGEERDPVVGLHEDEGTFTVPTETLRKRVNGVSTFNRLRGGEYMFLPSLSALEWLGRGDW